MKIFNLLNNKLEDINKEDNIDFLIDNLTEEEITGNKTLFFIINIKKTNVYKTFEKMFNIEYWVNGESITFYLKNKSNIKEEINNLLK